MSKQETFDKLKSLLKRPSFSSKEARNRGVSSSLLSYYVNKGELIRIGHGVYRGLNSPVVSDFRWEDLVDVVLRVPQGCVCLISALALYELTEEIPRQHWIAIPNNTLHRADSMVKVVRLRNMTLGRTFIMIDHVKIPIFNLERTVVDSFRYLGVETAVKALRLALNKSGKTKVDLNRLRRYGKKLRFNIEPYILGVTS